MKEWYRCSADEVLRELGHLICRSEPERGDPPQEAVWREPGDRKPERSALENLF